MRERIMDAALIEFSDKGIKFTMDDVAKRLRISKKTIYNFFKNKEVLLLETIDFGFAEVQKQKQEIVNDKDMDIIDKIKNVLIAIPEKYKGFDWRLIYQISEKYPDAYEKIEEKIESDWDIIIEMIEEGIKQKKIRNINIAIFKLMFEAVIEKFIGDSKLIQSGVSYEQALLEMRDIMVKGILEIEE